MVELVDTRVLRTLSPGYVGSSPTERTNYPIYREYDKLEIHYNLLTGNVNAIESERGSYHSFAANGRHYYTHIFAVYYMTGVWPNYPYEIVDHIDENKFNNKWSNLQIINSTYNQLKRINKRIDNKSGYNGVFFTKTEGKYSWQLRCNYERFGQFGFKCPTSAAISRDKFIIKNNILHARLNVL